MRAFKAKAKQSKERLNEKFRTRFRVESQASLPDFDPRSMAQNSRPPDSDGTMPPSTRSRNQRDRARSILVNAVKLAKDASNSFPAASVVFGGLEMIFDALNKADAHSSATVELRDRIESVAKIFAEANVRGSTPELIKDAKEMTTLLRNTLQSLKLMDSQGRWQRLIDHDFNHGDLKSLSSAITSAITLFQAHSSLRQENQAYIIELRGYLNKLPYVEKAGFRSAEAEKRSNCFENTRVDVLNRIEEWVNDPGADSPPILWLNGMAGTGKSTIAQTIAENAYARGILGASFFFSRMEDKRRDPTVVLPTLAYQLALTSLAFEIPIGASIKDDPFIGSASLQNQLQTLIVDPLRHMDPERPAVLIVLDALDECERDGASKLLQLLVAQIPSLPFRFRVLITSRPEGHIAAVLENSTAHTSIILHDIADSVVEGDISRYMQSTIRQIPSDLRLPLPEDWAKKEDIDILAKRAGKLFIYAATSILFLRDDVVCDPPAQLAMLIQPDSGTDGVNPHGNLDLLYHQVLLNAFNLPVDSFIAKTIPNRTLSRYGEVVGTMVLLRESLPMSALSQFIMRNENDIRAALRYLHSVIVVPSGSAEAPFIYHPSFTDYITSPYRCTDPGLRIDATKHEPWLATQCLRLLTTKLSRDMANIRDPSLMNTDVDGLRDKVNEAIPPEVRYACLYWASHLCELKLEHITSEVMDCLWNFLSRHLLWWFESLSLLENVAVAVPNLRRAHQWATQNNCDDKVVTLLYDGYRFALANSGVINDAALHVYHSALLFAPRQTMIWDTYQSEASGSARILLGAPQNWSACLRVSHGHFDTISSLAFSPDGRQLASGSVDKTVRQWDVATGTLTAMFEGHSKLVTSVSFSPDGRQLASGSADKTVRLWDVATGMLTTTFIGHSNRVTSVSFSRDGMQLSSGSAGGVVRLWNMATGMCTSTFKGHSDWVRSVAFSPDGRQVMSGSADTKALLWDVVSGISTTMFKGHSSRVTSVAFSPDGRLSASGSDDKTVRLWDPSTGTLTTTFEGHSDSVTSVTFSPDGKLLASGSADKTVRLWNTATGILTTFKGHSNRVTSVTFSPDGKQLVSGSVDKTVRWWDVATGLMSTTVEGHSGRVRTVAFSHDGRILASGSADTAARLWDVATGAMITTLRGHSDSVTSVTLSPDGRKVASGSQDKTVRLWDAATGALITTLVGHLDWVRSVTFSPTGDRVISRSSHGDSRVWDIPSQHPAPNNHGSTRYPHKPPQFRISNQWLSFVRSSGSWARVCRVVGEYNVTPGAFKQHGYHVAVGCQGGQVMVLDAESVLGFVHSISSSALV